MVSNLKVAAAVAAVLAAGSAGATSPSPASAAAPFVGLYVSGSSAAQPAVIAALESATGFCGGSYTAFSSTTDTNFFAVSCTPQASTGVSDANGSNIFTIWYRSEGGSVTGALPLVTGAYIKQLDVSQGTSSTPDSNGQPLYAINVSGASATNGIDDTFGSGVLTTANPGGLGSGAPVQLGITDVEPGALIGNNYPSAYKSSVYGKATAAQLASLTATTIFDQVFGVFVNTQGLSLSDTPLSISRATLANVLRGTAGSTNWNTVPNTNGNAVTSGSQGIVIVNREQGSGSRTATDIFFTTDQCNKNSVKPIKESTLGTADFFSTGNVLAAANSIPGSITYATIDNAGSSKYPNLTLVALDGITPSNLNAATGQYQDWFEATAVTNTSVSPLSTDQQSVVTYLISAFQNVATAPGAVDVLANPNYNSANTSPTPSAGLPVSGTASVNAGKTIYINPFTRSGNSCLPPVNTI